MGQSKASVTAPGAAAPCAWRGSASATLPGGSAAAGTAASGEPRCYP